MYEAYIKYKYYIKQYYNKWSAICRELLTSVIIEKGDCRIYDPIIRGEVAIIQMSYIILLPMKMESIQFYLMGWWIVEAKDFNSHGCGIFSLLINHSYLNNINQPLCLPLLRFSNSILTFSCTTLISPLLLALLLGRCHMP